MGLPFGTHGGELQRKNGRPLRGPTGEWQWWAGERGA
jgi:hypothetical protein